MMKSKEEVIYRDTKNFTEEQLRGLYSSVNWLSANYADRLVKAMKNSSVVLSAWHGEELIGLVNALDDGEMTAYVHYLLVHPDFQGKGVGKKLLEQIKTIYSKYLYLVLISEEKKNNAFYEKLGFDGKTSSTPMFIVNTSMETI